MSATSIPTSSNPVDNASDPSISVVMVVRNEEKYIAEAIQSILDQTLSDFEFIIVDDHSTDRTKEIIGAFSDSRIQLFDNPNTPGKPGGLNFGYAQAQGRYIAHMDGDDISLPDRLRLQYDFMESHPDIGVCGGGMVKFYERKWFNQERIVHQPGQNNEVIKKMFIGRIGVNNATALIRAKVIPDTVRYDSQFNCAEDYMFYSVLAQFTQFGNLPDIVYKYRRYSSNLSKYMKGTKRRDGIKAHLIHLHRIFSEVDFAHKEKFLMLLHDKKTKLKLHEVVEVYRTAGFYEFNNYKDIKSLIKARIDFIGYAVTRPVNVTLTLYWLYYKMHSAVSQCFSTKSRNDL